jgi:hypothetical protein
MWGFFDFLSDRVVVFYQVIIGGHNYLMKICFDKLSKNC